MLPQTITDTEADKLAFARAWLLEPADPFKAACGIFGTDTAKALRAATFWINDPLVLDEKDRLLDEEGEDAFLPSKTDALQAIWELSKVGEHKDRILALKLYAEVRGYMPKAAPAVAVQNNTINHRVMEVHNHGTNADWEKQLLAQQRQLISDANSPRH